MTNSNHKNKYLQIRHDLLICLALVIFTVAVYWQVTNYEFLNFDDDFYITENYHVQSGLNRESIIWSFTSGTMVSNYWHPLTWLSHILDFQLYGMNAGGHHMTSLLFHITNTLLLFFIFRRMTGDIWQSGCVATLFALHPLHVESVAWVAERKDVLSTFFWLLTMLAYCRYIEKPVLIRYFMVLLFFVLGLMSKPMLVTLPFVLLLMDYWPLGRIQLGQVIKSGNVKAQKTSVFHLVVEKIPFFLLTAAASMTAYITQQKGGALTCMDLALLKIQIANALVSYVSYIGKMIWPSQLAIFYPHPGTLPIWESVGSGLLLISVTVFVVSVWRRFPYLFVGWFWYIGTLVPVIGLVKVGSFAMADRYTYVSLIGLFIIVAWGVSDFFKKWKYQKIFLGVSATIILTALTAYTYLQLMHWQNSITLFENAAKVTKNNYLAHNNLGIALEKKGLIDEAIGYYSEALRIKPDYAKALNNMGAALEKKGLIDEAIGYYSEALRIKPDYAKALNNMGAALLKKGSYDEAVLHFKKALKINPQQTDAVNNLANVLFFKGKPGKAICLYREILKIDSENSDAQYNLAYMLSTQGKLDEAVLHYKEAIKINPEYAKAHYHLGKILINQGKMKQAMFHFAETIRISPDYVEGYNQIGLILAEQGKYKKAEVFFSKAIEVKPDFAKARNHLEFINNNLSSKENLNER